VPAGARRRQGEAPAGRGLRDGAHARAARRYAPRPQALRARSLALLRAGGARNVGRRSERLARRRERGGHALRRRALRRGHERVPLPRAAAQRAPEGHRGDAPGPAPGRAAGDRRLRAVRRSRRDPPLPRSLPRGFPRAFLQRLSQRRPRGRAGGRRLHRGCRRALLRREGRGRPQARGFVGVQGRRGAFSVRAIPATWRANVRTIGTADQSAQVVTTSPFVAGMPLRSAATSRTARLTPHTTTTATLIAKPPHTTLSGTPTRRRASTWSTTAVARLPQSHTAYTHRYGFIAG